MSQTTSERKLFSFPGGIHPEEHKNDSVRTPIKKAGLPPELIIPLQQHIGAPAKPIVDIGDKVLKGQVIAEAAGFVSVPVHASSSGEVIDIGERAVQHPSGIAGRCIVIKTDGLDQWAPDCNEDIDEVSEISLSLNKKQLVEKIKHAGIAGMGGAGFPSAVKLNVKPSTNIKTLILNSVECEPYITADDKLIQERAADIIQGLCIIARIVEPEEILIAVEDNTPDAIKAYKQALMELENSSKPAHELIQECWLHKIEVVVVPTKYPSGGEKQIIQILTGQQVPAGGLPSDIGLVCQNTGSAYAIFQAVFHNRPLVSRITTLTGSALSNPQNFEALIGTPFDFLLKAAGIDWSKLDSLVMGGPMMGFSVEDIQVPLVKTTNCILATQKNELRPDQPEQACIRCGSCAQACPASLLPQQLYWYSKAKELDKAEEHQLSDCIECGACSFVCPSNIPLVQYFRFAKGETRKRNIELEKSEQSRIRFEARTARLEQEEADKEAKRKQKAEERKQKKIAAEKAQENKTEDSSANTNSTEDLALALQTAKTKVATSSKQWKEAEKALAAATKAGDENLVQLQASVAKLEVNAQNSQVAFKTALANKKAAEQPKTESKPNSELEAKIEAQRETSADASQKLKNLKKALLSAKSGEADTSQLEAEVGEAKALSDQLKSELRSLIQTQKSESANTAPLATTPAAPASNKLENEQTSQSEPAESLNTLKIAQASNNAQIKKLENALANEIEDNTKLEANLLLKNAMEKSKNLAQKIEALVDETEK